MRVVSAEEDAAAQPWEALIKRLEQAFRDSVESPSRHHHATPRHDGEASILLMPAW